tara:strand:- start:718 stop:987 length:270 start_codon:yes stop_codon:yes gene_type:complete
MNQITLNSRKERWQWLRRKAGLSKALVRQYLSVMGCRIGINSIKHLEAQESHRLSPEAIACLSYIYNQDGDPANLNWVFNGLGGPYLKG